MTTHRQTVWRCCNCKSEDVQQEASQLYEMNGNEETMGALNFLDSYWCQECMDETKVEEALPRSRPLVLVMEPLPVTE